MHTCAHIHTIITYSSQTAHTCIRHTQILLEKGATRGVVPHAYTKHAMHMKKSCHAHDTTRSCLTIAEYRAHNSKSCMEKSRGWCGVAIISRLLQIVGLFWKRALQKRLYSAKETCNFKEPTDRSHPIVKIGLVHKWIHHSKFSLTIAEHRAHNSRSLLEQSTL